MAFQDVSPVSLMALHVYTAVSDDRTSENKQVNMLSCAVGKSNTIFSNIVGKSDTIFSNIVGKSSTIF